MKIFIATALLLLIGLVGMAFGQTPPTDLTIGTPTAVTAGWSFPASWTPQSGVTHQWGAAYSDGTGLVQGTTTTGKTSFTLAYHSSTAPRNGFFCAWLAGVPFSGDIASCIPITIPVTPSTPPPPPPPPADPHSITLRWVEPTTTACAPPCDNTLDDLADTFVTYQLGTAAPVNGPVVPASNVNGGFQQSRTFTINATGPVVFRVFARDLSGNVSAPAVKSYVLGLPGKPTVSVEAIEFTNLNPTENP